MKKIYDLGFIEINKENIKTIKNGVWAMFGNNIVNEDTEEIICLQVGKSNNIFLELSIDWNRLEGINTEKTSNYINQFGEFVFNYVENPSRIDYVYEDISKKYQNFFWILVSDLNDYYIEKYFAYTFEAKYWVSNGKYKDIVDKNEIERIKNSIDTSNFPDGLESNIVELKKYLHDLKRYE